MKPIKILYETPVGEGGWALAVQKAAPIANRRGTNVYVDYRSARKTWVVWDFAHHKGARVVPDDEVKDDLGRYGKTKVAPNGRMERSELRETRFAERATKPTHIDEKIWNDARTRVARLTSTSEAGPFTVEVSTKGAGTKGRDHTTHRTRGAAIAYAVKRLNER